MSIRSWRERVLQTLAFELGGIAVAAPLYRWMFGASAADSVILLVAVSAAVMIWATAHNTLFDRVEWRLTGRVASDRPPAWRVVHALSHELTSMVVTLPVIMALGGHGFWEALGLDLALTAFYAGYAYVFHCVFDRLRPVRADAARDAASALGRGLVPEAAGGFADR